MSADLPEGSVVLFCAGCRQFGLDGVDRWIPAQGDWRELLRDLAGGAKAEKDAIEVAMESDIRDPRWTDIS